MEINKRYLAFLGVLLTIDVAFLAQLIVMEKDFQPLNATEYGRIVVGLMTVVVLILIGQELMRAKKAALTGIVQKAQKGAEDENVKKTKRQHYFLLAATFVAFFFYCALFQYIGYYVTGFLMLIGYMSVLYYIQEGRLGWKNFLTIVSISAGTVAVIYLIFSVFFELWLPRGILF